MWRQGYLTATPHSSQSYQLGRSCEVTSGRRLEEMFYTKDVEAGLPYCNPSLLSILPVRSVMSSHFRQTIGGNVLYMHIYIPSMHSSRQLTSCRSSLKLLNYYTGNNSYDTIKMRNRNIIIENVFVIVCVKSCLFRVSVYILTH